MSPLLSVRILQTQSDARLLAAAREGNELAFEALVQRHRKPLLRYCRRLLLSPEEAEDALQQGLLLAWMALRRGCEVQDARAWIYRVVHNAAVDSLRTSRYDHEQLSESLRGADAPQADLDRRVAVRHALAGLAALPELQREALLRTAIDGHSHERVAAALGLSDGAVRGLVYRARATLRAAATAITPPPLFVWAATTAHRGAPLAQQLSEACAGGAGGPVGGSGALLKAGAAFLTAGALVAGAITVPHHLMRQPPPHTARAASGEAPDGASADSNAGRSMAPPTPGAEPLTGLLEPPPGSNHQGVRQVAVATAGAPRARDREARPSGRSVHRPPRSLNAGAPRTTWVSRESDRPSADRVAEDRHATANDESSRHSSRSSWPPTSEMDRTGAPAAQAERGSAGETSAEQPAWNPAESGAHDSREHGAGQEPGFDAGETHSQEGSGGQESDTGAPAGQFGGH